MTTNTGNGNTGNNGVARNGLPAIIATVSADVLEVDESDTRTGPSYRSEATANFADNFTVNAGTGATVSYALSLASDTGVDSGLFYSSSNPENGAKIYLFEENGKIVGRAGNKGADGAADTPDASGRIVFEVSVDASGVVKVQLGRSVKHNDPNDPDDVVSVAARAITLTATVTDSNGNSDSADLKLGGNIRIKDSAPYVKAWDLVAPRVLEVDESDLGTDATQSFSRNFNVIAEDGIPGNAASSVTLSVASSTGVDSGVIDAATGAKIFLFQGSTSGEIVGRVGTRGADGAADTADANGAVAFSVSAVDLVGNIKLDQKRGLKHGDPNNANEFVSLAADSITMTVTITDNDGDSASADLKLGSNIRFRDDVPTANDDRDTVAKDGATVATGNVVTGVDADINPDANARDGVADALGADGFGAIAWTGASNGSVAGTYGTLSVGTDGGYRYTLNNDSAAVRALTAGQTLTETFTYTVTDRDGDSATASLTVTIYGAQREVPAIAATAAAADVLEVDETDAGTGPSYRSDATANFADNFTVSAGTGATVSYALSLASDTGVDSGLVHSGDARDADSGAKVYLFEENGKIVGRAGNKGADGAADTPDASGGIVFEVSVNASGVVEVKLNGGVEHNDPNDPDDVVSLAADVIALTATVTDPSGNSASADLKLGDNIRIKDAAPSLGIRANGVLPVIEVDESDLGTDATGNAAARNGKFSVDWGTDSSGNRGKASSITLSVASETGVDSGVIDAATGARIFLFQGSTSGEIVGRVGTKGVGGAADTADANGAIAFMVSAVDLVGNIKLDQKRALKHGDPNNANEFVSLAADSITMTATITDSDGDSASADLKLGGNIRFRDDVPTANDDRDTVAKDGATVATGNVVTGVDADINPDANARDGVADALGADGFGAIAWTGASNGSVAGTYGTLSVGTDGGYRYTLNNDSAAVRALTAGQTLTETFTYTVTDKDGDSATASLTVTIYGAQREVPAIAATAAAADVLEVDETDAGTGPSYRSDATANFADNFTVSAGTGATVSYALSLASDTGVDSGLVHSGDARDADSGAKVYLFEENGKIVGRAGNKGADGAADTPDASGGIVFEVSVNASGVVEVKLNGGVEHNDPNDPDDVVSLAADVIALTATVTDPSGNSASADIKLGDNIRIKDAAPSLGIRANGVLPVIEVDESDLGTDATGNAAARNGKFSVDWGTDSSGNRGKASSITLSVASETGVDSGVIDAATGARIFLFQGSTSGEIVGRVGTKGVGGAADTADANGAIAFMVSAVDLVGNIKLDQKRALKHGDPNNANEFVSLAADSITMTATITDSDGDSASADLKLGGNIRFRDDAPTARSDADFVTEDGATVATGNVVTGVDVGTNPDANTTDGVADALGADGFGAIAWTGASNGSVAGTYGTLSVGTDGSYRYTLNNDSAAVQALKSGETLTETFAYRVTDKDGDSATASLTVRINGADEPRRDVPRNNDTAPLSVTVHEDALSDGNADTGQTKTATISATALASRVDAGTDGPVSFAFNGAVSGAVKTAAGADVTSGGEAVTWRVVTDAAGKATGIDGVVLNAAGDVARTVFELRKSGDDFSLDLKGPIDHPASGAGGDGQTLGLDLSSAFKAVDKSGDAVVLRTAVTASVRDDVPANNDTAAWSGLTVNEYGVTRAVGDLNRDQLPSVFIPADDSLGGVGLDNPLLQRVDAGADGLRGLNFNEAVSGAVKTADGANVTSGGSAVTWRVVTDAAGKTTGIDGVVLNAGGGVARTVFTVRKPNDSFFQFDLKDGLDHGAFGQTLGLDLSPMLKAVDGDGDSVVLNSALTLNVRDDGPEISVAAGTAADALAVDESALGTDATANFADNFTVNGRADGAQSVSYALSVGSETGVDSGVVDTATGAKVFLFSEGGKAVGRVGTKGAADTADATGAVAFEVGVDGNGRVTLDQKRALKHGDRSEANESAGLAADVITLTATVTDGDGDSASASVKLGANLTFRDDGPAARNDADSVTEDGATVATGNVVTGVDAGTNPDANTTDGVADALGADGFGAIAWTGASNGSVAGSHGTLSVGTDGGYRYTLNNDSASVQALKSGETLTETFTYTVTDKDGDSATASLTVTINGADDTATPLPSIVKKGGSRPENLFGTGQAEILAGFGGGDNLFGFGGDDVLLGGAGGDNLFGGAGNDILFGGAGNDFLKGNDHFGWSSSPDIFVLSAGRDTIADFKPGEDKINLFQVIEELAKNGSDSFQSIVDKINAGGSSSPLSIQASGRDSTISLGGTVKAILKGVSASQVSLSDFEFDNKLQDLSSTLGTDAF